MKRAHTSSLTVSYPWRPGDPKVIMLQAGQEAERCVITGCSGTGPYTLALRPYTRRDAWLGRLHAWLLWPGRKASAWFYSHWDQEEE